MTIEDFVLRFRDDLRRQRDHFKDILVDCEEGRTADVYRGRIYQCDEALGTVAALAERFHVELDEEAA